MHPNKKILYERCGTNVHLEERIPIPTFAQSYEKQLLFKKIG